MFSSREHLKQVRGELRGISQGSRHESHIWSHFKEEMDTCQFEFMVDSNSKKHTKEGHPTSRVLVLICYYYIQ
jgi:hypothetical protein